MTDHLPECPSFNASFRCDGPKGPRPCICPALEACEVRVWVAANIQAEVGRRLDRNHTLDAARDAVAALQLPLWPESVLAAIDALRAPSG